ncbi:MAG TPA: ACP S-malonyltransferase [Alphaproteobacteria bacterium]|nr:ACP S-malonyltransferase [Alphaproteobacteria bacterium]
MVLAFTFPGQGSQAVGMGKALAESSATARQVFEEVDEALKQNLTRLMFEGPADELMLTENAQPALMAVSLALVRTLDVEGGFKIADRVGYVAGHSLGEYSALAAAGALTVSEAAQLLKRRGQAMQRAVPVGEGAMAALLGLNLSDAEDVAKEAAGDEVCTTANDNAPGQVVVSGHKAAIERAVEIAKTKGARRAMMLSVSAPFHCPLMAPAANEMAEALKTARIEPPVRPLVANVTAKEVSQPEEIRRLLVAQVTGLVRWRESVEYMVDGGVDMLVELGSGKVLTGLAKRINGDVTGVSIQGPDDIEAFLKLV